MFDWSELRDLPLNPIGCSALVLLGTLPEPARRSRGPLGPKRRRFSGRERERKRGGIVFLVTLFGVFSHARPVEQFHEEEEEEDKISVLFFASRRVA